MKNDKPPKEGTAFVKTVKELESIAKSYDSEARNIFYFLNLFRLCSQLNINPGFFYTDWGKRISDIYNMWKKDAPDTISKLLDNNRINDCIIEDIRSNNWNSNDRDFQKISKDVKKIYKKKLKKQHFA